MLTCARCGAESPDGFRFCGACGAPLQESAPPRQARKVVTALFCDVTGSTALGEQLDPELLRSVLNRYFKEIRSVVERHGGTIEKFIGDAAMAVFGIPTVHEDDALRAVRAAAEIRARLPGVGEEVGVPLQFRTGVNTGPVLMGEGENLAIGDAVNVAARLEQAAEPGEIVIGEETLRLVRDAVEVEPLEPLLLKGKSTPVAAYRLTTVDPAAAGVARHLDVPLVGRTRELDVLRQAWDGAVQQSRCQLFTLLGEAGVGKSRLVAELLSEVAGHATVLKGRCLPYGEGITFWPLVEALTPVGEPATPVLDRLSSGGAAHAEELFWDVRRLLESLAVERPVVLYLDDLQWAEEMLFDLLDHVVELSRGVPILLLCTARPELLEERTGWGGGKLNATTALLEPLTAHESEALLEVLGDGLDQRARARVIEASEGNPLFLEEMVALARERGTVEAPPTIQALLAARLERLAREERELLERGAVEGEVFHRKALHALAGDGVAEVELRLGSLVRQELIRPHRATFEDDEAFRFRHLLIRDAAYEGLPKATRAELHERFARWLELAVAGLLELDEIVGWHLEQAVGYQQELARPIDPELARDAAQHLYAAGRRASERLDIRAASTLLARALALAPERDPLRPQVAVALAEQLGHAGEFARAGEMIAGLEDDPDVGALALLTRLDLMLSTRVEEGLAEIDANLPQLLERLTRAGDHRGLARAHMLAFHKHLLASVWRPAGEAARLAAEHAAIAGDEGAKENALGWYVTGLIWGPEDARAIERELDRLEREQPGPYLAALIKLARGETRRLDGNFEDARMLTHQSIEQMETLGTRVMAAAGAFHVTLVELSAGNPAAALAALERSDASLAELGEHPFRSTFQGYMAWAHVALGHHQAALAAADRCEQLSAPEDVVNFAMAPLARARVALAEGQLKRAEELARDAVHHACRTDSLELQAEAKLTLARILAARERRDEAETEARAALERYQVKSHRPGIADAEQFLAQL